MAEMLRPAKLARLDGRGIVEVSGPDAAKLLHGILTSDIEHLAVGQAVLAALLTPQGKILFEMIAVRKAEGFLLETALEKVPDLVKRLTMYRLRAQATINDVSANYAVVAAWDGAPPSLPLAIVFADPRHPGLGHRLLLAPTLAEKLAHEDIGRAPYDAHRIALGIAEAGRDYALGDTFPHEANYDVVAGVSFSKGCYVGQEVVARMQNKTVVRKRVVRVRGAGPLAAGAEVKAGDAVIGSLGSVAGRQALAMVRLDRVAEAVEKKQPLTAAGLPIEVDAGAIARYRTSAAERQANP